MLKYEVLSEQEAMNERFQLLNEGEYDAVVIMSQDKISNSGNPMMDMILAVYDGNGKEYKIRDFLVFTKPMMWKVIHFAASAGITKEYDSGNLCSKAALNKVVRVKITVEIGGQIPENKLKGKPLGMKYQDKNKIDDYLKKDEQNISIAKTITSFKDEDITFL